MQRAVTTNFKTSFQKPLGDMTLICFWQELLLVHFRTDTKGKGQQSSLAASAWLYKDRWYQSNDAIMANLATTPLFPVGSCICSATITAAQRNIMNHHSAHLSPLRSCQTTQESTLCPGPDKRWKGKCWANELSYPRDERLSRAISLSYFTQVWARSYICLNVCWALGLF